MAVYECKICGGRLQANAEEGVGVCEYCGTRQTLPRLDSEKKANLYDRANHYRRNNEFDKAMGYFEQVLAEDTTDAEAYWSLVLCRYGVEYVEDPATYKRVPTVNRAQYTSVFDDENYKAALRYAGDLQRHLYEEEARVINEIQKGILSISQKEEPFDVFICYKETDATGRRTPDSVLANDLYHQLSQEGLKVFFARITLEDKLGTAYEPYIFAALNSAKVMVVIGSRSEYFNAVWVKNEWSRYLSLIRGGAKKVLIPAYKDMDPYDLPEEFSHLQAQDMSKLGFMQDLIRGIRKLVPKEAAGEGGNKNDAAVSTAGANGATLLKRGFLALEDGEWGKADGFFERVLDMDAECAEAYLGKLLARLKISKKEDLVNSSAELDTFGEYNKVLRFGSEQLRAELTEYGRIVIANLEEKRRIVAEAKRRREEEERIRAEKEAQERSEEIERLRQEQRRVDNMYKDVDYRIYKLKQEQAVLKEGSESPWGLRCLGCLGTGILVALEALGCYAFHVRSWSDHTPVGDMIAGACVLIPIVVPIFILIHDSRVKQRNNRRKEIKASIDNLNLRADEHGRELARLEQELRRYGV